MDYEDVEKLSRQMDGLFMRGACHLEGRRWHKVTVVGQDFLFADHREADLFEAELRLRMAMYPNAKTELT